MLDRAQERSKWRRVVETAVLTLGAPSHDDDDDDDDDGHQSYTGGVGDARWVIEF